MTKNNDRQAVILAGGLGTRLKPYTVSFPKPLMPVGEHPILEVVVRQLRKNGFTKIIMAVNHQADLIRAYFGEGKNWDIHIEYSLEKQALGTMGPLKIIQELPENFLVMNGDILTDLNFKRFFDQHVVNKSLFTISSYTRKQHIDYGVLETNDNGKLIEFLEKPTKNYLVSMGVYMLNRRVLDFIPKSSFGFDELMLALIENKEDICVNTHSGAWLDIGRPDDYEQAIELYSNNRRKFI
jgi:NDP-sugar pyrophosphorylase family protein